MHSPLLNQLLSAITVDPQSGSPLYLQAAEGLIRLIRQGKLKSGQKLPGSRELALVWQLNRVTVNKAIEELQTQGWLESFVGKGTFVASYLPENNPVALANASEHQGRTTAGFTIDTPAYLDPIPTGIDLAFRLDDGFPDPRLAPIQELYRAYRSQLQKTTLYNRFGSYNTPEGPVYYRTALSRYLNETRGLNTTARQLLSIRGTVMGINLVCQGLIAMGDVVVSGIPGWGRAERNFLHAGARHIGIPVDAHGLVVDELRKICRKRRVRMVYVTPHHHYPTTVSMRLDRRLELLQLAHEYGFILFEDDYDYDFHYKNRPLQPLASEDTNGMVIYCGSFSKNFSPAFRMGYLSAPENVIEHLARHRLLLDRQGDHVLDNAMGELLNEGTIQRYLRKALHTYHARRDHFCQLLTTKLGQAVEFDIPEGGLSVWARFDPAIPVDKLAERARRKGLFISNGLAHHYPGYSPNAIRLGFASSTESELTQNIDILARAIR
ncbi:PLP-dependent aminotransferase family protein [Paraflavitalea pollutisoli]|uniref:aminotransferase-like domain-containing protein n=1 Tax=Paraflavitalea pollutisoli TaxID=3034143 RepID=UPI0023EAA070|nr:PLP-dependent aminotransferase family protein [Paraflavitalea sp. H1-2-19X]